VRRGESDLFLYTKRYVRRHLVQFSSVFGIYIMRSAIALMTIRLRDTRFIDTTPLGLAGVVIVPKTERSPCAKLTTISRHI